jgi:hypothetical protein
LSPFLNRGKSEGFSLTREWNPVLVVEENSNPAIRRSRMVGFQDFMFYT